MGSRRLSGRGLSLGRLPLGDRERLANLAVVAVDRQRLQTELPPLEVDLLDLLDGGRFGHINSFAHRTG